MNKQELFEKISDLEEITVHIPTKSELTSLKGVVSSRMNLRPINYLRKSEVLELIEQLDEPKKPVIPQFVAEWIEKCKEAKRSLYNALEENDEVNCWLERDDKIRENEDTFARAWLDGYEIEKEKLYTVEIPDPNNRFWKYTYLQRGENGVQIDRSDDSDWSSRTQSMLTEAEIKQDFEWAWQWAKPVEG